MFSCRDATSLMTDEREGHLSGGARFKYRVHMLICGHCRAFRRQLEETIGIVKDLPRPELPRETEDELAAAFRARATRSGELPR
jgi:hypothetical protein